MVSPWRRWADRFTLIRAVLGAPLLVLLASEQFSLAWLLLLFGAFTDWADGWMARRADGGSSWGARLDPLADKLMISAPLIWLAATAQLPIWSVWLLLARVADLGMASRKRKWRTCLVAGEMEDHASISQPVPHAVARELGLSPAHRPGPCSGLVVVLAGPGLSALVGLGLSQTPINAASAVKSGSAVGATA